MTSRERVLLSINQEEPDRLPLFKPNTIPTYEPFDEKSQHFLDTFEFDRFELFDWILVNPEKRRSLPDDMFEDGYGCKLKYKGVGGPYCIFHPLAYAETIQDVDKFTWPDVDSSELIERDARKKARELREKREYATAVSVATLFHQYQRLRGFDQWLIDLKTSPKLHEAISKRIHHINVTLAMALLKKVGDFTDIVMAGDDFGTSTAPFMSPEDFKTHIKPYYKDLIGRIKGLFPHIKICFHSHGQIMDLVPDLIDCGVDILNPILPLDNMNPTVLKQRYGKQLCFHGGIDIEQILPFGTLNNVKEHVKHVIDILAPGGGYLFRAQAVSRIIPYENLSTTYELALEYGIYGS